MSDPKIEMPYKDRVFAIRMAVHYTKAAMSKVLDMDVNQYIRLEKGEFRPRLNVIRRIRILERAFSIYLEEYYRLVKKFGSKWTWGKETKIYERYGGRKYKKLPVGYRCSSIIPGRDEDIEALGGMRTFSFIKNPIRGKVG